MADELNDEPLLGNSKTDDEQYRKSLSDESKLIVSQELMEAALLRLGRAVLAGGPLDDIGPAAEDIEEYHAASDAVKFLAVTMAQIEACKK